LDLFRPRPLVHLIGHVVWIGTSTSQLGQARGMPGQTHLKIDRTKEGTLKQRV
jgi:hypothetical protein